MERLGEVLDAGRNSVTSRPTLPACSEKPKPATAKALREPVAAALRLWAEFLAAPKALTPTLLDGWCSVLTHAGIQPDEVGPAATRLLASSTFFPTPADFLKVARPPEDADTACEVRWQLVLRAVQLHGCYASLTAADLGGDGHALFALERVGWVRLCQELTEENRAIFAAEFRRVYRAALSAGATRDYLAGTHEVANGASRFVNVTPALCGRPDWPALPPCHPTLSTQPALPENTQ